MCAPGKLKLLILQTFFIKKTVLHFIKIIITKPFDKKNLCIHTFIHTSCHVWTWLRCSGGVMRVLGLSRLGETFWCCHVWTWSRCWLLFRLRDKGFRPLETWQDVCKLSRVDVVSLLAAYFMFRLRDEGFRPLETWQDVSKLTWLMCGRRRVIWCLFHVQAAWWKFSFLGLSRLGETFWCCYVWTWSRCWLLFRLRDKGFRPLETWQDVCKLSRVDMITLSAAYFMFRLRDEGFRPLETWQDVLMLSSGEVPLQARWPSVSSAFRPVCMYVCMYTCMYVCDLGKCLFKHDGPVCPVRSALYVCVYVCTYMYVCIDACTHVVYIYIYVYIYICMYIYVYIYMYVYICIHIYV